MARAAALLALAALAVVGAAVGAAAQVPATSETIIEYLQADERFTILIDLLDEAGLLEQLNATNASFTFFAPTNEAINSTLSQHPNATASYNLTQILQYHIVPGDFSRVNFTQTSPPGDSLVLIVPPATPSAAPSTAPCTCQTSARAAVAASGSAAAGSSSAAGSGSDDTEASTTNPTNLTSITLETLLRLDSLDQQAQRIKTLGDSEQSVLFANNVNVTEPDIQVRNGYIQIIDGLLTPPGNVTVVADTLARNFSLWVALVERLNATDLFADANSTVLLPIELSFTGTGNTSDVPAGASGSGSGSAAAEQGTDGRGRVQALISLYNDSEWQSIFELMVIPSAVLYTDELAAMLLPPPANASSSSSSSSGAANASEVLSFTTAADTGLNISVAASGHAYELTAEDGQTAAIVRDARLFDLPIQTGVLHVISRLLLPASLAGQQAALDRLLVSLNATQFAQALISTGAAAQISGGNYTLFVPNDDAFAVFNASGESLQSVVDVHIVPGEPAIVDGAALQTLLPSATLLINHDQVAFTVRVLQVACSFANVLRNVTTDAFQIYTIDRVLQPPSA